MSAAAEQLKMLIDAGVLVVVGSAYPASAAEPGANDLIEQFGYEFGPWQLCEPNDVTDGPWSWLLIAVRPDVRAEIAPAAAPTGGEE